MRLTRPPRLVVMATPVAPLRKFLANMRISRISTAISTSSPRSGYSSHDPPPRQRLSEVPESPHVVLRVQIEGSLHVGITMATAAR
jgi:hypothetical protein